MLIVRIYLRLNFKAFACPYKPSSSAKNIELSSSSLYLALFLIDLISVMDVLTKKSSMLTGELNLAAEFVGITWLGPAA